MFDPYHKWLAIPKDQRPPNYYQLLGIATGEDDPDVIEEAALMRIAHVRSYQIGPHAVECAQLLRELGEASAVLSDAKKRAAYDASLGIARVSAAPSPAPSQRTPSEVPAGAAPPSAPRGASSLEHKPLPPPPRRHEWDDLQPVFERPTKAAGDPHQNTPRFEIPLHLPQHVPDEDPFERLRQRTAHLSTAARDHEAVMRQLSAQAVRQLRKPMDAEQESLPILLRNLIRESLEALPAPWRRYLRRGGVLCLALLAAWLLAKIGWALVG